MCPPLRGFIQVTVFVLDRQFCDNETTTTYVSSGSLLAVERLLSAYGAHQSEFHQHNLVTEPWKLPVANHLQTVMQCVRVAVACAVRIHGL